MLRAVVLVNLFLAVYIGLVTFLARQQPLPPRLAMLHLTDCAPPCWIGITPGVTTVEQAKARIQAVYGDGDVYQITDKESGEVNISRSDDPKNVPEITVDWPSNPVVNSLGILINTDGIEAGNLGSLIGIPPNVSFVRVAGRATYLLMYKNTDFMSDESIYAGSSGLFLVRTSLHDTIFHVLFTTQRYQDTIPSQHWHGFGATYNFNYP